MKTKKYSKGFTLVELLVVIAIIGILAAVVLVSISGSTGKANRSAFLQEVSGSRTGLLDKCATATLAAADFPTSSNVNWTVPAAANQSCGTSGNLTYCAGATNKKKFVSTPANPTAGFCQAYVSPSGVYSDATCTTPILDSTCP